MTKRIYPVFILILMIAVNTVNATDALRPIVRGELGKDGTVQRENMRVLVNEIELAYRSHADGDAIVQCGTEGQDGILLWVIGGLPVDKRVLFLVDARKAVSATDARRYRMILAERLKETDLGGGNERIDPDGVQLDVTEDLGIRQLTQISRPAQQSTPPSTPTPPPPPPTTP